MEACVKEIDWIGEIKMYIFYGQKGKETFPIDFKAFFP